MSTPMQPEAPPLGCSKSLPTSPISIPGKSPARLITEDDRIPIFQDIGVHRKDWERFGEEVTRRKSGLCPIDDNWDKPFQRYQEELKKRGQLEFDDQVLLACQLLKSAPPLREALIRQIRYLLVDEFQDSNPAQYRLMKLLAPPGSNLFVVADDAQAIYGFRGSDSSIVQRFENDYRPRKILLERNYRASPIFSDMANRLIRNNHGQVPKTIKSVRPSGGTKARIFQAISLQEEAKDVVARIKEIIVAGVSPNEISILYRNHDRSAFLKQHLKAAGLPFVVKKDTHPSTSLHQRRPAINLMTLHASKGLEWDAVFIIGMEEGSLPYRSMMERPEDIAEERRLCYVGITRARRFLFLSYALDGRDRLPSRFIDEMVGRG